MILRRFFHELPVLLIIGIPGLSKLPRGQIPGSIFTSAITGCRELSGVRVFLSYQRESEFLLILQKGVRFKKFKSPWFRLSKIAQIKYDLNQTHNLTHGICIHVFS